MAKVVRSFGLLLNLLKEFKIQHSKLVLLYCDSQYILMLTLFTMKRPNTCIELSCFCWGSNNIITKSINSKSNHTNIYVKNVFSLKEKITEQIPNQFTIINSIIIILKFTPNLRSTKYNNKTSSLCLMAKENLLIFFALTH